MLRPTPFVSLVVATFFFVLPFLYFSSRTFHSISYPHTFNDDTPNEVYMTLYCPPTPHPWTEGKIDYYFEGTRIQIHNLLHKNSTKDPLGRPFVVLTTDDILPDQVEILERDGAIVRQIPSLLPPPVINMSVIDPRWKDQFSKLRLWNMSEYDRILYMDCDVLPIRPLSTLFDVDGATDRDGDSWLFAAVYDSAWLRDWGKNPGHVIPANPDDKDGANAFNAGLFLLQPNHKQAAYINSLYSHPPEDLKYGCCMEQDLLRYAYRDDGPFPWMRLSHMYNTQWPRIEDITGSHALHGKLWEESAPVHWRVRTHWFVAWGEMRGWSEKRGTNTRKE